MLKGQVVSYVRNIWLRSLSERRKPLLVQCVGDQMFELGYPDFETETLIFRLRRKCIVPEFYFEDAGIESQMV